MSSQKSSDNLEIATFAGGCFWCMQPPYDKLNGVQSVTTGYIGGTNINPTYENFVQHGHKEAVQISFDPQKTSYEKLLEIFWQNIDPTDAGGQFADRGQHYQTAIFYHNNKQKLAAEISKRNLEQLGKFSKPIATQIIRASEFYPAEEYHQAFYEKNPEHYASYKYHSGRGPFLERTWKEEKNNHKKDE